MPRSRCTWAASIFSVTLALPQSLLSVYLAASLSILQAHIWDAKKQVYLGGFDNEVQAAKAHDIMAVKCRGVKTIVNFKLAVYEDALPWVTSGNLARVSAKLHQCVFDLMSEDDGELQA